MPGYKTKVESIGVTTQADLTIRSLLDRQQFSDPDGEAASFGISSATWPLFGYVWPSGRILASHMATFDIAQRRVLELGCGLGLASMVMRRGGVDVTASDIHPLAAAFLLANIDLNQLGQVPFHRCDWATDDATLGRFGLLVGSDLLYERSHASDLSDFIDRHADPIAEVIIVDPNRGHRAEFRRLMSAHDFVPSVVTAPTTALDGVAYRGQILTFLRRPSSGL